MWRETEAKAQARIPTLHEEKLHRHRRHGRNAALGVPRVPKGQLHLAASGGSIPRRKTAPLQVPRTLFRNGTLVFGKHLFGHPRASSPTTCFRGLRPVSCVLCPVSSGLCAKGWLGNLTNDGWAGRKQVFGEEAVGCPNKCFRDQGCRF